MHELSIAQEIIRIIKDQVDVNERPRVRAVQLRIGSMTNILDDSLQFCFAALIDNTPLHLAKLDIEKVPLTLSCYRCKHSFVPDGWAASCPQCGGNSLQTVAGQELDIRSIELEENTPEVV